MIWSTPVVEAVAESLARHTGLDFPPSRVGFADLGIRRVMAKAPERDSAALLARLQHDPSLLQDLLAEVTVGETYFFRDTAQFDVLRTALIPEIAARTGAAPRVWSAGCSTGEEPYSLAILLEELHHADARIVGTDVCAVAIQRARRGRYLPRSFRNGLEPAGLGAFAASAKGWLIDRRFRERVTFAVDNLVDPLRCAELGDERFDIIVCRNVLIYFAPDAVARAADVLVERVAPGGYLITSPTDPLLPPRPGIAPQLTAAGIIYRRTLPGDADNALEPRAVPATPRDRRTASLPPTLELRPRNIAPVAVPCRRSAALETSRSVATTADAHVASALHLLDVNQPREALIEARRARYLDPSCPVAQLAVGRALRLCGNGNAARRALHRSGTLLARCAPEQPVARAGGLLAGALAAIVAAELQIAGGPA